MITLSKSYRVLAAVAVALSLAACNDAPDRQLTPQPMPLSAARTPKFVATVGRPKPLTADITRSLTVTNSGGTIEIKEAGLKLDIPSNALPDSVSSMTITVTAFKGAQYAYEFEPSGTVFRQPLRFEQDMNDASLVALSTAKVAYFRTRADLNQTSGVATTFEDLLTNFDIGGKTVRANLWHFSGYIMEW